MEIYADIFKLLGPDGLKSDFHIWSSGLFPFFQYASTAVRPAVLDIFERYYLPLGAGLRSSTKGIQLALLSGLEEETGDFFDRVMKIFDKLSEAVEDSYFAQCMFLVMMTSSVSRAAVVNYLTKRLPQRIREHMKSRTGKEGDVVLVDIIGPDGGLFVRALAAGLEDNNALVCRGALDLLASCLPIESLVSYADFAEEDREILVKAASGIVLRKDLSLSRRVYHWFLGTSEESTKQIIHFRSHGLRLMTRSLKVSNLQSVMLLGRTEPLFRRGRC